MGVGVGVGCLVGEKFCKISHISPLVYGEMSRYVGFRAKCKRAILTKLPT